VLGNDLDSSEGSVLGMFEGVADRTVFVKAMLDGLCIR
jgi:hypothetical protein